MVGGILLIVIAKPVGIITAIAFGVWWLLLHLTADARQKRAVAAAKNAHQQECDRLDAEYEYLCAPIEEANERIKAAWNAAKEELDAQYHRACKKVDAENRRLLAPWEAVKAAIEEEHKRRCQEIDQENRYLTAKVEEANAARIAEHERAYKAVETANRHLTEAWQASTAARAEAHAKACREIDETNRRMLSAWEAVNAPWLAEVKRLKQQLASAEAEINRLEAALYDQRKTISEQFERKKRGAEGVVSTHSKVKQQYDSDMREAEQDSKRIHMEQHLDSFLIRQAKIKGITSERVLSLESFGIETANDIDMLNTQKVPGIGPVLTGRLFDWKNTVATKFVLKMALPEAERHRIASRYAPVFLPLIQSVQAAIRDLELFGESQRNQDRERINAIRTAVKTTAIVAANLNALNQLV
jgi:hypothetical protein